LERDPTRTTWLVLFSVSARSLVLLPAWNSLEAAPGEWRSLC